MKLPRSVLAALVAVAATPTLAAPPSATPEHRMLDSLAGTWSVQQSFWKTTGAAPRIDHGTADFTKVFKGRHLRQNLHIADGTGFEGLGFIGYDDATREFFSTWMDTNFPGLVVARGAFDKEANAYVFRGTMPSASAAGSVAVREVMTIEDHDHFKYEYYETHDGAEALTVRLEYSRSG